MATNIVKHLCCVPKKLEAVRTVPENRHECTHAFVKHTGYVISKPGFANADRFLRPRNIYLPNSALFAPDKHFLTE